MATTTNFGWATPDNTSLVRNGASAIRTLGSSIDTSFVDLKGGTTGQYLKKTSGTDLDFEWASVGSYTAYTPTFTNFTLGNGTINVARYAQSGKTVHVYGKVTLGSTSSMGTNLIFTLPVTASSNVVISPIGLAQFTDTGTTTYYGFVLYATTTTARLVIGDSNSQYFLNGVITSVAPMTWVSTDTFTFDFTYEAA
jgi:hypothetical protein